MQQIINITLIVISILLTTVILLQQRGAGAGGVFGGSGEVYRTKRGADKILFYITIGLCVLFFGIGLYNALFV